MSLISDASSPVAFGSLRTSSYRKCANVSLSLPIVFPFVSLLLGKPAGKKRMPDERAEYQGFRPIRRHRQIGIGPFVSCRLVYSCSSMNRLRARTFATCSPPSVTGRRKASYCTGTPVGVAERLRNRIGAPRRNRAFVLVQHGIGKAGNLQFLDGPARHIDALQIRAFRSPIAKNETPVVFDHVP